MKTLARTLLAGILLLTMALPASAITRGGAPDGDAHPYVGLMVAYDADDGPMWRCSGAMISPRVYVTAGHCTSGADGAEITFLSDDESAIRDAGYPFRGFGHAGTPETHPLYIDAAFFLYDLGVVVLDEPVLLDSYATLPELGAVDGLGKGRKNAVVTAVGYGLQRADANPNPDQNKTIAELTRYQADLFVVDTNGVAGIGNIDLGSDVPPTNSMILSGDAKHGGTCFGDSGGPALVDDTIVGVTSFGLNGNCAGIGGTFRIDRQFELDWIGSFLGQ